LIQCWNIVQQIERDCFSVAKPRSIYIYTTLAFLALLGAPYIYISSLRVNWVIFSSHISYYFSFEHLHSTILCSGTFHMYFNWVDVYWVHCKIYRAVFHLKYKKKLFSSILPIFLRHIRKKHQVIVRDIHLQGDFSNLEYQLLTYHNIMLALN